MYLLPTLGKKKLGKLIPPLGIMRKILGGKRNNAGEKARAAGKSNKSKGLLV